MAANPNNLNDNNSSSDPEPSYIEAGMYAGSFLAMSCGVRYFTGTHWNQIIPGLYLSALPIETKFCGMGGHHEKIIQQCEDENKPLDLIVSVVRDYEIRGTFLPMYPVSKTTWEKHQITQHQVKVQDFTAEVKLEDLNIAVEKIYQTMKSGKSALVHCKAGVARSWMLTMCYLLKYGGFKTIEEAKAHITSKRPQVSPCENKLKVIRQYIRKYIRPCIKRANSSPNLKIY